MIQETIGDATLYCGDCLQVMAGLADRSADMVLCDLPYGTTRCRWDAPLPLGPLWQAYDRLCSGAVVLFAQTPFDKVLGASNLRTLRYEWIWEKTQPTGHLNARKMPLKAHENLLVFYRARPTYNPQKTAGHPRKAATKRKDSTPVYGRQGFTALPYDSTERYPRSVLVFPSDRQRSALHLTQKPVALCEYMVRTYTGLGDVVLDNCMGSGTTGVACLRQGRRFVGIERDRQTFEVACRRLEGELRKLSRPEVLHAQGQSAAV